MMRTLWMLALRNMGVFVRDRMSIFFSFLSVVIIIGIYALFLGNIQVSLIKQAVGDVPDVRFLIDSWIVSGLLAINSVNVTLGVLGTMVHDTESRRLTDFVVAPISRTMIVLGYLLAACIIGFVFGLVALVAGEAYIVAGGGSLLSLGQAAEVLALLALTVIAASAVMYFIVSFLRSTTALGTLSTLVGTLIGFLTGVYVPQGVLPGFLQKVIALVPFSHAATLLRQVFCAAPIAEVFLGVPNTQQQEYLRMYGIHLYWGGTVVSVPVMLLVLVATSLVFLFASALRLRLARRG